MKFVVCVYESHTSTQVKLSLTISHLVHHLTNLLSAVGTDKAYGHNIFYVFELTNKLFIVNQMLVPSNVRKHILAHIVKCNE